MDRKIRWIIYGFCFAILTPFIFWGVIAFVATHFVLKFW